MILVSGAVVLAASLGSAAAARDRLDDPYSIMAPEPWLAPKHKSPRGIPQKPNSARTQPMPAPSVGVAEPAPPITLRNGQIVPSLPPVNQGMVPGGGRETFGDRAARCAHQSGLYGVPGDQRHNYMHSCTQ